MDKKNNSVEQTRQLVASLIEQGALEQVAEVLKQSALISDLETLILEYAPSLLEQGEFRQLQALVEKIPVQKRSPGVLYWYANTYLPINPLLARSIFEQALIAYEDCNDLGGSLLCWSGIVDSFVFAWDNFAPLDAWIQWIEQCLDDSVDFPSSEIAGRVTFSMFCALMYRQPQHSQMNMWADKVGTMLDSVPDKSHRIFMATHYVLYLSWMGQFEPARIVIERLNPTATIDQVQPIYLIAWYQTVAMQAWLIADFKTSQNAVNSGLQLAGQSDIHVWDFILRVQQAYLAMEAEPPAQWQSYLQQVLDIMDEHGRLHQAHYYYMAALEALLQKHQERALLHVGKSLAAVEALGTPFPVILNLIAKGRILIELGQLSEARQVLTRAERLGSQIGSAFIDFNLSLSLAEWAFAGNNDSEGLEWLASGLRLGRTKQFFNTDWWRRLALSKLCIKALKHDIEKEYVVSLIRQRKLLINSPPLDLIEWPWPVIIHTLGRFTIQLEGKSYLLNGNGSNKPIELLKLLIALGGRDVSEILITETLWPDAEGDKAHSAFTTTLSRLRKMFGSELLIIKNGLLSLNDCLCWLDIWAFEKQLEDLEQMLGANDEHPVVAVQQKMQLMFDLYQGLFLENEVQQSWMLQRRERLRNQLLRMINSLIRFFSRNKMYCSNVITLYEKAREVDPWSEAYCRGLMRCHAVQGNRAEALSIYERCQIILKNSFGIEPSEKTLQLYQTIKSGDQDQYSALCDLCIQSAD